MNNFLFLVCDTPFFLAQSIRLVIWHLETILPGPYSSEMSHTSSANIYFSLWYGFGEFGPSPPEAGEPGWLRDPAHCTHGITVGAVEKTASQKSSAVMREAWHRAKGVNMRHSQW